MKPTRSIICASFIVALCASVSAQAQTAKFDQVHLAAADPAKAVDWYQKHLNAEPWHDDEPFRVKSGTTRVIFRRAADVPRSEGSVVDHIGWSFANLDAKVKELQEAGVKVLSPVTEIPGMYKAAFIEDPWGVKIQVVQDREALGFHHVQLVVPDPEAMFTWLRSGFGGERTKLKGKEDALKYGSVFILARKGGSAPSKGTAIDHIGFGTTEKPGSVAAKAAQLQAAGVKFVQEPHQIRVGSHPVQVFIIEAPAGLEIEVLER
jgi:catechol 2,3-dioxygenase-like lactoylglutathione lyase family enzyme